MGLDARASRSWIWRAHLCTSLGGNRFSLHLRGRGQPGSCPSPIFKKRDFSFGGGNAVSSPDSESASAFKLRSCPSLPGSSWPCPRLPGVPGLAISAQRHVAFAFELPIVLADIFSGLLCGLRCSLPTSGSSPTLGFHGHSQRCARKWLTVGPLV